MTPSRLALCIVGLGAPARMSPYPKTYPPVGGTPAVQVHTLHQNLSIFVALNEPGAEAMQSGI